MHGGRRDHPGDLQDSREANRLKWSSLLFQNGERNQQAGVEVAPDCHVGAGLSAEYGKAGAKDLFSGAIQRR